jgi:KUP system potassium uptake protein
MLATTLAFYAVARLRFGWSRVFAWYVCAGFVVVDLAFVGANSLKLFDGGYIPLLVGAGFILIMVTWARGRSLLGAFMREQALPTETFLADLEQRVALRMPGVAVVMTAVSERIPAVLIRAVRHFKSLHETVLLTTIATEEVPYRRGERCEVTALGKGLHRVVLRYGFMEEPDVHRDVTTALGRIDGDHAASQVIYLVGHERTVGGRGGKMGWLAERLFGMLLRNARNPSEYYHLPPTQVLELGARVDL